MLSAPTGDQIEERQTDTENDTARKATQKDVSQGESKAGAAENDPATDHGQNQAGHYGRNDRIEGLPG